MITASSAHKALGTQASINQLICEKCQPIKTPDATSTSVNINSPLHWGQKYEPLSVMLYEDKYKTTVEEFGCIKHEKVDFLGASPDGINVDNNSHLYGRMLEIKNVVSREITGIPKKEYWIQMQLQMEVCDLNDCDFLETKFTEFENETAFIAHPDSETKGVIMYFNTQQSKPFYVYMPLNIKSQTEIDDWVSNQMDIYESSEHNMIWIKNCYWKLVIFLGII